MLKEVNRFEKLWTAYVTALREYDVARTAYEALAALKAVETLYNDLVNEYGMNLGGAL